MELLLFLLLNKVFETRYLIIWQMMKGIRNFPIRLECMDADLQMLIFFDKTISL